MKPINKEHLEGRKLTRTERKLTSVFGFVALVGLMLALGTTAFSSTAMAAHTNIPVEEIALGEAIGTTMFFIGIVLAIILLVFSRRPKADIAGSGLGMVAILVTALLLILPIIWGIAVAISGPVIGVAFCDKPENALDPVCVPREPLKWTVVMEADLDAAGATYPAAPMTVCDTAIGGTSGEWVAADGGNVKNADRIVTTRVHIDTDLADTDPLWMEPNCIFIEIQRIQLTEGPKASSGAIETQFYFARIDSISVTRLPTDNATVTKAVFHEDTDGRHHLGYQFEDGSWNEACPEFRGQDLPRTGCGAIPVGTDDGTGDTTGAIASAGFRIFWVWEDRGPFAFRDTDGTVWTLTYSIGSADDWHTYQFIATMDKSDTDNS